MNISTSLQIPLRSTVTSSSAVRIGVPVSVNARSRYVVLTRANGSHSFELRAHNGSVILLSDADVGSAAEAVVQIERLRSCMVREDAVEIRQSLTGKWFYRVRDGDTVLAISRPFAYRSRMEKAMYAARACAPASRVVVES